VKRLSIIVPIFNVESFLGKCLQTLETQNISKDEYEIICINDGSPDKSRSIVIEFQKQFQNIILLDQENKGVSLARNHGIDKAAGKYLLFIDADDYVDPNCLKSILDNADYHQAQVDFLGFTVLNEDYSVKRFINYNQYGSLICDGPDAYRISRGDGSTDPDRIYSVLFEREFINRNLLRFLPGVPYLEDGEFIARILCLSERCIFNAGSFYQRTTRSGSAVNSDLFYSEKAINGFLAAAGNLKNFQERMHLDARKKEFLNQPIVKFVILAISSSLGSFKKLRKTINKLKQLKLKRLRLICCNRKYRMYGRAYNFSPMILAFELIIYPRLKFQYFSNILKRLT
jgi:glycosyltransferase involved in cell wall biosynthesis